MSFPFSVLQTKKEKSLKINNHENETIEVKNIRTDFDKKIKEFAESGLSILNRDDLGFISKYPNYFYRNNIMMLMLTLNLRRDSNFKISPEYDKYKMKIFEGVGNGVDKINEVNERLEFQLLTYNILIDNTLEKIKSSL